MPNNNSENKSTAEDSENQIAHQTQPWTDETVSLFWKYENTHVREDSFYFSHQCGPALIMLAKEFKLLQGSVLDYSAARGHLSNKLLDESSITVEAVEYTDEAVNALNKKFQDRDGWNRASLFYDWIQKESGQYDLIFCIEVIEHLLGDYLESTIKSFYDCLQPGGSVLFTTPNEEHLKDHFAFCPFCRTEFHPVQHVRSFSKESLTESLTQAGFEVKYCQSMNLMTLADCLNPNSWKMSRYNYLKMQLIHRYIKIMDAIAPGKKSRLVQWVEQYQGPHLLAVATKPAL
ncbi:MAG: class I SAM-dependent methyltransferase [Planctomycetaceae bacterium]|nr:class I SAM-dependent methyltransferase [Planctomycetaceae bacterium]